MSCNDYCCNHGCNQERDCPARAKPAQVAPYKPKVRRECGELGVCQSMEPRCEICACDAGNVQAQEPHPSNWDSIAHYAAVLLARALTVIAVCGFAGYAYVRWLP
ncbi:MAG: hypothetical protein Q8R67_05240 [Rhodoferax sp.]|nr:hypothetical protein [Rhodoferax sp.]MDP3651071.1 hypothetical protein [Rhodoferax sp.]